MLLTYWSDSKEGCINASTEAVFAIAGVPPIDMLVEDTVRIHYGNISSTNIRMESLRLSSDTRVVKLNLKYDP